MTELALTFKNDVAQKLQDCQAADQDFKNSLLSKLEKTRSAGLAIEAARHDLRPDEFRALLDELGLTQDADRSYVSFAKKHPEPVHDLKLAFRLALEASMATGLLPAPQGHAVQQIHQPNFFSKLTVTIQLIASEWRKYLNRRPLDDWPPELKEQFLGTLDPVIKIYKTVRLSINGDV